MASRRTIAWLLVLAGLILLAALAVRALPSLPLESLEAHRHALSGYATAHPAKTAAIFMLVYIAFSALPLPGSEVLSIAAGAIFGLVEGTLLVSFASSIGATLAFLVSRWWLRDLVRKKLATRAGVLSRGIEAEGMFYLFALRLAPLVPYFFVSLAMGLTKLRAVTFYWVSLIAIIPATIAYVNAGQQLAGIRSVSGILSPRVLLSLAALGLLPLAARYVVRIARARRR